MKHKQYRQCIRWVMRRFFMRKAEYIALAIICLWSTSCVENAPDMNKSLPGVTAGDIIRFQPVWESEKTIPLPANIVSAIRKLPAVRKPVSEVTAVIPELGCFQIENEEYRWVMTGELITDKLSEQGKVKILPNTLSPNNVMPLQQWHKMWNFASGFDNATEEEKAYMTNCLMDAFIKIDSK